MKHVFSFLAAFLTCFGGLSGCIDEYSLSPGSQQPGRLVVEGYICGNAPVDFRLARSVELAADTAFLPEREAEVYILRNDGVSYGPGREIEPGLYRIEMGKLDTAAEYCLEFTTGNQTYRSAFHSPAFTPEIDSLHWEKKGPGGPVDMFVSTHDETGKSFFYLWTFQEDWELTANYHTHWFYNPKTYSYYYEEIDPVYFCWNQDHSRKIKIASTEKLTENRIVNQPIHTLSSSDIKLSYLYCLTVSQRGLSREGYEYYEHKRKMNEEAGGLFAPQPSELKGNIACVSNPDIRVTGFIEVGSISHARFFIEGEGVYEFPPERACTEYYTWSGTDFDMYYSGLRPYVKPDYYNWVLFWANAGCLDCTFTGTKNKPDFWPNDDQ